MKKELSQEGYGIQLQNMIIRLYGNGKRFKLWFGKPIIGVSGKVIGSELDFVLECTQPKTKKALLKFFSEGLERLQTPAKPLGKKWKLKLDKEWKK